MVFAVSTRSELVIPSMPGRQFIQLIVGHPKIVCAVCAQAGCAREDILQMLTTFLSVILRVYILIYIRPVSLTIKCIVKLTIWATFFGVHGLFGQTSYFSTFLTYIFTWCYESLMLFSYLKMNLEYICYFIMFYKAEPSVHELNQMLATLEGWE